MRVAPVLRYRVVLHIIEDSHETIDGAALDRFKGGRTYEGGSETGALLANGAAVPVIDGQPIASIPPPVPTRKRTNAVGRARQNKGR